jgi:hypothetical protein
MATEERNGEKDAATVGAYHVTEHIMSVPEVADRLATNVDVDHPDKSPGLSTDEV